MLHYSVLLIWFTIHATLAIFLKLRTKYRIRNLPLIWKKNNPSFQFLLYLCLTWPLSFCSCVYAIIHPHMSNFPHLISSWSPIWLKLSLSRPASLLFSSLVLTQSLSHLSIYGAQLHFLFHPLLPWSLPHFC